MIYLKPSSGLCRNGETLTVTINPGPLGQINVALTNGSHWLGIENKIYYRQILVTAGAGQAAAVEVHLVPEQRQPNPTDHEQRSCRSGECYKGNGSFDYIRAHILTLLPTPLPESLPRQIYDRYRSRDYCPHGHCPNWQGGTNEGAFGQIFINLGVASVVAALDLPHSISDWRFKHSRSSRSKTSWGSLSSRGGAEASMVGA